MPDETKVTLKMGVIASGVAALIVMVSGAIYNQQSRITVLETNYSHVCETLNEMKATLQEIRRDQLRR